MQRGQREPMLKDREVTVLATFPQGGSTMLLRTMQFMCGGECTASTDAYSYQKHKVHRTGAAYQYFSTLLLDSKLTALLPQGQAWSKLGPHDALLVKTHHPLYTAPDEHKIIGTRLLRLIRNPVGHILSRARHLGESWGC